MSWRIKWYQSGYLLLTTYGNRALDYLPMWTKGETGTHIHTQIDIYTHTSICICVYTCNHGSQVFGLWATNDREPWEMDLSKNVIAKVSPAYYIERNFKRQHREVDKPYVAQGYPWVENLEVGVGRLQGNRAMEISWRESSNSREK